MVSTALQRLALVVVLAVGAALVPVVSQAAVGFGELRGAPGDGPITLFYPTSDTPRPLHLGPFRLDVAAGGKPAPGNGRLVVVSHGAGGSAITLADLGQALAEAGFTVAIPEHRGDNWRDMADVGPVSWKRRPAEISRAIDAVLADARFRPHLAPTKVGVWGMSAGGLTALVHAGARWTPAALQQHCERNLRDDFPGCIGLDLLRGDATDADRLTRARTRLQMLADDTQWQAHHDPRVAAVVAVVPLASPVESASVRKPRVPLGLVLVGHDRWLARRFHGDAVLRACASCEVLADLPTAGHGSMLSPPPPGLQGVAAELLADPPGFDRALVAQANARAAAFFRRHLLP